MKDSFQHFFNEINLIHIAFITTISVFIKEFVNFLFEYFGDFKLKDSIGKFNKGNITEDIPSILNQDNGSSNKPEDSVLAKKRNSEESSDEDVNPAKKRKSDNNYEDGGDNSEGVNSSGEEDWSSWAKAKMAWAKASGSGAQASGSGTQASGSGAQASGSGVQASGSGAQASGSQGIADDPRNYQYSDSGSEKNYHYYDSDDWKQEKNTRSPSFKSETDEKGGGLNDSIGDDKAVFESKVAQMENSEAIRDLKEGLSTAKQMYQHSNVPAAKTQIAILEEKIAICESRISEIEAENMNQSKDKGKGIAKD